MDNKVPYENWPEYVKVGTAFSNKHFLITHHRIPLILGYLVLAVGILNLGFNILQGEVNGKKEVLSLAAFLLVGLFNLNSSKVLKWITDHSTWEERFANTSSNRQKALSILSLVSFILTLLAIYGLM